MKFSYFLDCIQNITDCVHLGVAYLDRSVFRHSVEIQELKLQLSAQQTEVNKLSSELNTLQDDVNSLQGIITTFITNAQRVLADLEAAQQTIANGGNASSQLSQIDQQIQSMSTALTNANNQLNTGDPEPAPAPAPADPTPAPSNPSAPAS
jgi:uncharacterized phage infection (PIP) family protein YhgE